MRKKPKKLTPEERAALEEFDHRSEANLKRLRELVDRGWGELERKGVAKRPS